MKEYREKDVMGCMWNAGAKDLEFNQNSQSNLILFSLYLE